MPETPVSLLERLRDKPKDDDWQRWSDLYRPVLQRWLGHAGVRGEDVDEVIQRVFVTVWSEMSTFDRERVGSFRKWLRGVVRNRMFEVSREARRRPGPDWTKALDELQDSDSGLSKLWDQEHDQVVLERLMQQVEARFSPSTARRSGDCSPARRPRPSPSRSA